jgi:hypothetical protein
VSEHYILEGRNAVPCDLMTWARWFETAKSRRVISRVTVGDCDVSTVFLGLNHAYGDGPPQIFETMVFGGKHDGDMERCSTYEEAEAMHAAMVERVSA